MSRSIWKKLFVDSFLVKSFKSFKNTKKIWSRRSSIPSSFVGKTVLVYNGKDFKKKEKYTNPIDSKIGKIQKRKCFQIDRSPYNADC